MFVENGLEVLEVQPLVVARRPVNDARFGIVTVHPHLRGGRVAIGRERLGFDDDGVPLGRRPVETRHENVQVDGERVHGRDFLRLCPGQRDKAVDTALVVARPGPIGMEMPVDCEVLPVVEFLFDHFSGARRLQTERVATEVHGRVAVSFERKVELAAESSERVVAVEVFGKLAPVFECHVCHVYLSGVQRAGLTVPQRSQVRFASLE